MSGADGHVRVTDFYTDVVLPALADRLDQAFPEFGWRRDARGWVATNEEHTHSRLGARADRVVAHGPAPRGFLVHGAEPMLWTAYVSGGPVPRGREFVEAVRQIAERAGIDASPIERDVPRDRRAEMLETFFDAARHELITPGAISARAYLEERAFPMDELERLQLGVVPDREQTRTILTSAGFGESEIEAAGLLVDSRWPGRLCGAWRNEYGRIGTFWARSTDSAEPAGTRYLYLRGASRSNLPPYGFRRSTRELVLVEGFLDYHQLAAHGVEHVAALGGTSTSPRLFEQLGRLGVDTVVLCLDTDQPGRSGTAKAIENAARARRSPAIYVANAGGFAAKDPDALVREQGIAAWREVLEHRECGIVWRAKEMVRDITHDAAHPRRRKTLRRVGAWIRSLPPRLALEQEDAVQVVAERCGYSRAAAQRALEAWFSQDATRATGQSSEHRWLDRRLESGIEL